uniref:Methyltransf_11 domain-containing protein n=1 Tax=Syphacia muris TaxID=451379 RepID=A0A0N5ACI0_9BILA
MLSQIGKLLVRFYYYVFDRLIFYPMLYLMRKQCTLTFLNLGYKPKKEELKLDLVENNIQTDAALKAHVYLYEQTLSACPQYPLLTGMNILEVSCGHGGGLRWIMKTHPEITSAIGIDLYVDEALQRQLKIGDAHNMPFKDDTFDLLINVESSHLYRNIKQFFMECSRVLRPNKYLCWTDLRYREKINNVLEVASSSGFQLINITDITREVLNGIELTAAEYDEQLDQAPRILRLFRNSIRSTYCAPGTDAYLRLATRQKVYATACWRCIKNK